MLKRLFLSFSLFMIPHIASAALSPVVYERAQSHASDVLLIKTGRVIKYRLTRGRLLVKVRARVLRRYRSNTRRRTKWITIRYITKITRRSPKMLGGPIAIPILRSGTVYKAYLNRIRSGYYYTPAAAHRSFISQSTHRDRNRHRRRHISPRKRLF